MLVPFTFHYEPHSDGAEVGRPLSGFLLDEER